MSGRPVVMPVEVLMREQAFRHGAGIVDLRADQVPLRRGRVISARRVEVPIRQRRDRCRKRVQEQLVEVESMPFPGLVRTIHTVGIELTGTNPFNPDVPHITRAVTSGVEIDDPGRRCIGGSLKQVQPNAGGVTAEESEVDPSPIFMSAHGERNSPPHFSAFGNLHRVIVQRAFRCLLGH